VSDLQIEWTDGPRGHLLRIERHGRGVTFDADDLKALRKALRVRPQSKGAVRRDYTPQVIVILARAQRGATVEQLLEAVEMGRPTLEQILSRCHHAGLLRLAVDKSGKRWRRLYVATSDGLKWDGTPTIHPRNPIDHSEIPAAF
jgi:hypothetical protein